VQRPTWSSFRRTMGRFKMWTLSFISRGCRHDWFYYTSTKCAIPDDIGCTPIDPTHMSPKTFPVSTFFFSSPPVCLFIAAGIPHQTPHLQAAQPAIAGQAAVPLGGWIFGQGQGQRLGRLYPVQPRHRVPGFAMHWHTGRFLCCVHCMRPPDPVCSAKVCIILPRPAMHRTHVTHSCTKTHTQHVQGRRSP
jgi:hypothetical protein